MGRIPTGDIVWSLRRYTRDGNLWDRVCSRCKQATPVFEYEHHHEQGGQRRPAFGYLCEGCAQKKLAEWLQCAGSPDYAHLGYQTDFDIATVFYEQKMMKKPWCSRAGAQNNADGGCEALRRSNSHLTNLMSVREVYKR